jgi:putative endonuclease
VSDGVWFVYVLLNERSTAYTGIAKDVAARLVQHNTGRGARFTRGRGPWQVIHREGPMDKGDALRREQAIKRDARFKASLKAGLANAQCSLQNSGRR